jgi:cytochrome P450
MNPDVHLDPGTSFQSKSRGEIHVYLYLPTFNELWAIKPAMEMTFLTVILILLSESAVTFYVHSYILPNGTLKSFIVVLLLFNSGAYAFNKLIIYPFFRSPLRHLPRPASGFWPIIGHGLIMFQRPPGEPFLRFTKNTANDGIIYWRSLFHADRLLVTSPAAIADILVHNSYDFEKPPETRNFLRKFLGNGLLTSEGDEHKHQRKDIMPAFHFRHIKELYPVFWSKSIELCKSIKNELQEGSDSVIDITHFSAKVAMDIIGLAGLGRDVGSLRNSDDELIKNYEEILDPTFERFLYFILHLIFPPWLIKALPWKLNKSVETTTTNLNRMCREFVVEKKDRLKLESSESKDILSIMLRSNNFSDHGLADQLLTFLAAG